ncbi:MAG: antitoxin MazE family protein [Amaricoccus sp.]
MSTPTRRGRREALRAAGLRPIEIWVPDPTSPGFAEECGRQSRLVAGADLAEFLDHALPYLVGDCEEYPAATP